MNALTLASVVPDWVVLIGKIFLGAIVVVVLFIICLVRANVKDHEKKDDTIDPGDF